MHGNRRRAAIGRGRLQRRCDGGDGWRIQIGNRGRQCRRRRAVRVGRCLRRRRCVGFSFGKPHGRRKQNSHDGISRRRQERRGGRGGRGRKNCLRCGDDGLHRRRGV